MSEFSAELYAAALMPPPEFWIVSANDEQPDEGEPFDDGKPSEGNMSSTCGDNSVRATEEGASKHLEPDKPSDPSDPQR